ncbi:uncharacterized protein LOC135944038 [Cloeon dipterum]|uniref:uncharacterized protein LOC135944038 n=1 Tax=Cloeon dipterum TaxID=197152 RepID=UPI00321FDF8C
MQGSSDASKDTWTQSDINQIPSSAEAFVGGYDKEDQPIFVARAWHEGDLIPGKANPAQGNAFISWSGKEESKDNFEILTGKNFFWQTFYASEKNAPEDAVVGGHTNDGESLYVGKVHIDGANSIGKIQLSHASCYVPWEGKELAMPSCEILIRGKEGDWLNANSGDIPSSAFSAGNDHHGPIYVCRSWHESDLIPGKAVPAHKVAYVGYDGNEHIKIDYEVLCGSGYSWISMSSGYDVIPKNAVPGGQASDGEILYIGRVQHEGVEVCGKIHPSHHRCFIPYGGKEVAFDNYFDILCFDN